jgi:hypothetical protein
MNDDKIKQPGKSNRGGSVLGRAIAARKRRRRVANCKSITPLPEESPHPKPKRKDKLQERRNVIATLNVLRRKFSAAADEFPELGHVAIQRDKDGMYPAIYVGYESTSSKFPALYWVRAEKMPREGNEAGYPTKHWLRFFDGGKYDVPTMINIVRKFSELAWIAGEIVAKMDGNILPVSKTKLWVKSLEEYWILMLLRFKQRQWLTLSYPKSKVTLLTGDEPKPRPANKGEPCFCCVENLFLESAVLCEVLLANLANEQDYITLNVTNRTITIGTQPITITSERVWDFIKDLVSAAKSDRLVPVLDGAQNNKNNFDQLRRKVGGTDNLKKLVISTRDGYKLSPAVKVLNSGQVSIRKTYQKRQRAT